MKSKIPPFGESLITISQILSLIYVYPIFAFASLTVTGLVPGKIPTKIRTETIILTFLGVLYLIFPIWLQKRRSQKNVPTWAKYLIFTIAASPILFYLPLIFLSYLYSLIGL